MKNLAELEKVKTSCEKLSYEIDYFDFKNEFKPLIEENPHIKEFFNKIDISFDNSIPVDKEYIDEIFSNFVKKYKIKRK